MKNSNNGNRSLALVDNGVVNRLATVGRNDILNRLQALQTDHTIVTIDELAI